MPRAFVIAATVLGAAATALAVVVHLVLWLPVTSAGAAFLAAPPRATTTLSRPSRQRSAA